MVTPTSIHETPSTKEQDLPAVLVVDDDSRNLVALESVLDTGGFRLIKAQTGAEALLALMSGNFAAIVLDVEMPDMSGIELARMIKERKRTQHIPIIFLTAHYREEEHAVLGYDVGAVDYLTKPINPVVLRSKVSVFVDLFTKTRALAAMNQAARTAEEALRLANAELAARNEALEREARERALRVQAESARDAAEEANAAKDRFLAMLSHELRTPLSPIVHAVSLIEDIDCPPTIREQIETIRRNVHLEARLIDDLLDLARIRNGKLRIELQPVNVHEVLRHAIGICRADLSARRVTIVEKLEACRMQVLGDPARLQQVLWNLLSNAAKFSREGGVIEINTANLEDGFMTIEVKDHGVGIAPEQLERIFGAFEQGETRSQTGLGLGLAICRALVEMHGGTIAAHSEGLSRGACFSIRFPIGPDMTQPVAPEAPATPVSNGLRLLVVEDHVDTLATLSRLLSRRGFFVLTAASVAEALRIAGEHSFDVLVSDIGLPDGRGTDLLEQLGELTGQRPPSVAMSGFGMEEDIERCHSVGFSEHLTKPVEFSALLRAINRATAALGTH